MPVFHKRGTSPSVKASCCTTRIRIGSKHKPQGHCPGAFLLDQTLIEYAAFFLRQPSRPNPARLGGESKLPPYPLVMARHAAVSVKPYRSFERRLEQTHPSEGCWQFLGCMSGRDCKRGCNRKKTDPQHGRLVIGAEQGQDDRGLTATPRRSGCMRAHLSQFGAKEIAKIIFYRRGQ